MYPCLQSSQLILRRCTIITHTLQIPHQHLLRIQVPSIPNVAPPCYHTRIRRPPPRLSLSNSTNHPIAKYASYQDSSAFYHSFLSAVESVPIPRSVHEALRNPK